MSYSDRQQEAEGGGDYNSTYGYSETVKVSVRNRMLGMLGTLIVLTRLS